MNTAKRIARLKKNAFLYPKEAVAIIEELEKRIDAARECPERAANALDLDKPFRR